MQLQKLVVTVLSTTIYQQKVEKSEYNSNELTAVSV